MPCENIRGVPIDFPYEPYDVQKEYMDKVIQCLGTGWNGVLESPTGTGKTLSLLCASLAWLRYMKQQFMTTSKADQPSGSLANGYVRMPRIIYASRTHSQITQVMAELKRTSYNDARITVLGSRDQLCIHPQVSKEETLAAKNSLCRLHMKAKSCYYGNKVESIKKNGTLCDGIVDIEDLVKKSKALSCCPYYLARELQDTAEIIFMPYNYLLDPQIRKSMNIILQDCVIILDEAHNVEKVCEEASSISLVSSDIAGAIKEVGQDMKLLHNEVTGEHSSMELVERDYSADDLCMIKEKLQALEKVMNDLVLKSGEPGYARNGSFIFDLLNRAQIDPSNSSMFIGLLNKISETLTLQFKENAVHRPGASLQKLSENLEIVFSSVGGNMDFRRADKHFRVYIEEEVKKNVGSGWLSKVSTEKAMKVNFWCFSPGFGMDGLLRCGVRSVILTSGTLTPIATTVKELSLDHPIVLENPHIIKASQVMVSVVTKGPRNVELNSSFQNRQNIEYWQELGLTLQNFSRIVPDGVLVFFPSYTTLEKAQTYWQETGLWSKISLIKPIFVEPKNKGLLNSIMQDYYNAVRTGSGRGAILMGVCRGKVSEGLDFSNEFGRAVLITGLPYPPLHDPKVKLKKQYIDEKNSKSLSGEMWYHCEATRAVNQAIGRVIRHSNDFGAILLCDSRFASASITGYLSKWLQPHVKSNKTFGEAIASLRIFFRQTKNLPETVELASPGQRVHSPQKASPGHENELARYRNLYGNKPKSESTSATPGTSQAGASCLQMLEDSDANPLTLRKGVLIEPQKAELPLIITWDTKLDVQPAKKRKILLRPMKFELRSGSSDPEYDKRLNEIKDFVCEVKHALDDESYSTFTNVVKKYQLNNSIKEILTSLELLFLKPPEPFIDLFKGCKRFFSGSHQKVFVKFCKFKNIELESSVDQNESSCKQIKSEQNSSPNVQNENPNILSDGNDRCKMETEEIKR